MVSLDFSRDETAYTRLHDFEANLLDDTQQSINRFSSGLQIDHHPEKATVLARRVIDHESMSDEPTDYRFGGYCVSEYA